MKTGFGVYHDNTPIAPMMKLVLGFIAVFERQVICRAITFMYHNNIQGQEGFDACTKESLKFSTLSPKGIACALRPYLMLAYDQGMLREEDCDDNVFAKRALSLFPQIHAAWENGTEVSAQKWVEEYVMQILTEPSVCCEEALLAGDVDAPSEDDDSDGEEDYGDSAEPDEDEAEEEEVECACDFCEEFRGYADVDMDQVVGHSPIDDILIGSVKQALVKFV